MLAEFVDKLSDLARKSCELSIIDVDDTQRALWSPEGISLMPKENYRRHKVYDLDSFLAAVKKWGAEGTVWHGHDGLVLVCDDSKRKETVTFELVGSLELTGLMKLREPKDQRAFVRALRQDLARVDGADTLGNTIARLSFRRHSDGRSEISQGKESLGRSVESAVQAVDDLPEFCRFTLSIYANYSARETITCALAIDLERETLSLTPVGDEYFKAVESAHAKLKNELVMELEDGYPIFHGNPEV